MDRAERPDHKYAIPTYELPIVIELSTLEVRPARNGKSRDSRFVTPQAMSRRAGNQWVYWSSQGQLLTRILRRLPLPSTIQSSLVFFFLSRAAATRCRHSQRHGRRAGAWWMLGCDVTPVRGRFQPGGKRDAATRKIDGTSQFFFSRCFRCLGV